MKKIGNLLWGLIFIAIGLIWGLNALGITNINLFFSGWWTFIIIIPCLIGLIKEREKTGNLIGLLIGVLLLLCAQGILSFDKIRKLFIPIILVIIGISFLFKELISSRWSKAVKTISEDGLEEYAAVFAGQKIALKDDEFKGARLDSVFGGIDFDIREANVVEDKIIHTSSIFGGIEIYVPQNVNVKVKSTPIFGGVSNKTENKKGENIPTIYINAFCLFGGVDIK